MSRRCVVALLLVAAVTARAEPRGAQLALGVNGAPLVNHLGAHVAGGWEFGAWRAGAFHVGVQAAAHFYLQNPAVKPQPGTSFISNSVSVRPSLLLGHTFVFAERFRLGGAVLVGPNIRFLDASLVDARNGLDLEYHHVAVVLECAGVLTVGWKFTEAVSIDFSLALPIAATGSSSPMQVWLVAPPYLGLTVQFSLPTGSAR